MDTHWLGRNAGRITVRYQSPIGNTIFYYYVCRRVPRRIEILPIGSRTHADYHSRKRPKCEIRRSEISDIDKVAQWDVTMIMASRDQFFEPWLYVRSNVTDQYHFWLEETDYYTWNMLKAFGVFHTRLEDVDFAYGWYKTGWPCSKKI